MQKNKPSINWKTISGERIRRQNFNFILVLILLVGFMVLIIHAVLLSAGKQAMPDIIGGIIVLLKLALVWAALLLLNIFCVGKTVCILTREGLHCAQGFYKWERIQRMEFHLPGASYSQITCAGVRVMGNGLDETILHAPFFLLLRVKKYSPKIVIGLRKEDKLGMLCIGLAVIVLCVAVAFAA